MTLKLLDKTGMHCTYEGITQYDLIPDVEGDLYISLDIVFENGNKISIPFDGIVKWEVECV